MKYITLEELVQRKQELIRERDERLKLTTVGYDNAIALLDELIQKVAGMSEAEPPGSDYYGHIIEQMTGR